MCCSTKVMKIAKPCTFCYRFLYHYPVLLNLLLQLAKQEIFYFAFLV